ncbi:K(+)-transporting ATPase subunit F [Roseiarcaceae bacterium H3SJ34-1]|uniref:K(+)-transporting ATPase subunit F n=1 Tax=Terripilifer ovatus TaxID=3032367 RepID=UPI003AB99472|nr:K(+)-transporting ATPase subunit F [Roseiarcaceae bacterium H3SJ34-1]
MISSLRASVSPSSPPCASTRCSSNTREEASMFDALIGLAVALGLGVYLVITLLKPERF